MKPILLFLFVSLCYPMEQTEIGKKASEKTQREFYVNRYERKEIAMSDRQKIRDEVLKELPLAGWKTIDIVIDKTMEQVEPILKAKDEEILNRDLQIESLRREVVDMKAFFRHGIKSVMQRKDRSCYVQANLPIEFMNWAYSEQDSQVSNKCKHCGFVGTNDEMTDNASKCDIVNR
jgi:hypothetical protein